MLVLVVSMMIVVPSASAQVPKPQGQTVVSTGCQVGGQYDPRCDVNHDNVIDVVDTQLVAAKFTDTGTWTPEGWGLTGNSGTVPGTNFLGTTDNKALDFRVNNLRALRLQPQYDSNTPNLIGGYEGNSISQDSVASNINGGGQYGYENKIFLGNQSTICGGNGGIVYGFGNIVCGGGLGKVLHGSYSGTFAGLNLEASNSYAVSIGGTNNIASNSEASTLGGTFLSATGRNASAVGGSNNTASGISSFTGGGENNQASGEEATTIGGRNNQARGGSSAISGGMNNLTGLLPDTAGSPDVQGTWASITGGLDNVAQGNFSMAGGHRAKALHFGSYAWADGNDEDLLTDRNNQYKVRATGGLKLVLGVEQPGNETQTCEFVSSSRTSVSIVCKSIDNGLTYTQVFSSIVTVVGTPSDQK